MSRGNDVLGTIVSRLQAAVRIDHRAEFDAAAAEVFEEWGGVLFVAGRDWTERRDAAIVRDYLRGERVALLARRYSLTARRIQQIIKDR